MKNPHAIAFGRLGGEATAATLTPGEKSAIGRKAGSVGGPARAAALTPKQRKAIAKKAGDARWNKAVR